MDAEIEQQGVEPEIAEYPEAGPYWVGLWAVARHWVALLADMFEPDIIASTGISRSFALRCRNWLWPIEALVRRLVIAAAMKLDLSQLPIMRAARPRPSSRTPRRAVVSFAVLPRLPGRGAPQRQPCATVKRSQSSAAPEHRHLAFPNDNLLNLFPRRDKRNARPASRHALNPLHRRGRRNRWDPDYQGNEADAGKNRRRHSSALCPEHIVRPIRPSRPEAGADSQLPPLRPARGDLPEWKRIEREWERVIPSTSLAGRIQALLRVLEKPERWVERTARRLKPDLVERLRSAPLPYYRKPKLDRSPYGFLSQPLAHSHVLLDTS